MAEHESTPQSSSLGEEKAKLLDKGNGGDKAEKPAKKFMPYRTYIGKLDSFLGISMFWSEKLFIIIMYLQRYALLLLWPNLRWPSFFTNRMTPMFGFLLDFSAHHQYAEPLGSGTVFEGCENICKVVWPMFSLPVLFVWAFFGLHRTLELYYTRNIERIAWGLVRVGLLPFMNTMMRYFMLNQNGNIDEASTDLIANWITPVSEVGVALVMLTSFLFVYVAYIRSSHLILFDSNIRHEAWVRARELEYKLRFSAVYRNERVWMVSSYTKACWWWSFVRGALDILLLAIMTFVPAKPGIIVGVVLLGCNFLYGFALVDIHRMQSSNLMEHTLNLAVFIFAVFGCLKAWDVRASFLLDTTLDQTLYVIHFGALGIVVLLICYYFWDSHKFGTFSVADKRANKKWKRQFGDKSGKKTNYIQMSELQKSKSEKLEEEAAAQEMHEGDRFGEIKVEEEEEAGGTSFYLPKEATFFSMNHASSHVWPINGVVINELLRRNQEDHLIDTLRAARKMLDRVSALHNTAMLIPTDEMKLHITRLKKCVAGCQRSRITHHANAIHPLHSTFEDLIEQFSFELRVFSGRSITVGHNARKMISVSRYLRRRMLIRDHALALVSPLMRRVLIKLLALRMWIQLIYKEKDNYLLGPSRNKKVKQDYEAFATDLQADSEDGDSVDYGNVGEDGEDVFGAGDDELDVNVPLLDDDQDQFDFEHANQLAKGLETRSPKAGDDVRSRSQHSRASMSGQSISGDPSVGGVRKRERRSVGFGLEDADSKKDK